MKYNFIQKSALYLLLVIPLIIGNSIKSADLSQGWVVLGAEGFPQIEIMLHKKPLDQKLILNKAKTEFVVEQVAQLSGDKLILSTLNNYYIAVINAQINKLTDMHNIEDGTRSRFSAEVKNNPKKFSGFDQINTIQLDEEVRWGNYVVLHIRLYGETKLLTPWTLLFYCTAEFCSVSDLVHNQDENFTFLSSALVSGQRGVEVSVNQNTYIKFENEESFPIMLRVNFSEFQNSSEKSNGLLRGESERQLVEEYYSNMGESEAVKRVSSFISRVWIESDNEKLLFDQDHYEETLKNIDRIVAEFWGENNVQQLILNYDFKNIENTTNNPLFNEKFSAFSATALLQRIASWKYMEPYKYLVDEKHVFMWWLATDLDGITTPYLFTYDKDSTLLDSPDSTTAGILIANQVFAKAVVNLLFSSESK